jgi:hypothetical protein
MADDVIGSIVGMIGDSIKSNLQRKQDDFNNFLVDLTGNGAKIKQKSEDEEDLMNNPVSLPVDRIFTSIGRTSSGGLGGQSGSGVNLTQLMKLFIK